MPMNKVVVLSVNIACKPHGVGPMLASAIGDRVTAIHLDYATSSQTPPASVIFFSANLLKYLARITTGISGIRPFPSTFEYPRGRRSRTGAVLEFFLFK